jgi:hypothetical protein
MLEQVLFIVLTSVVPFFIGAIGVWLYYRDKFTNILTELEDKKAIIAALANHSDEIERENVKKLTKTHNAKVSKKEKTTKKEETPKRKYKKQSV